MKWVLAAHDAKAVSRLSDQAGIHPLIARLMVGRGITEADSALSFLKNDLSTLSDPYIFKDMDRAVRRIKSAVSFREHICIYGDYDVDGVTGSAVLYSALRELGAAVSWYIPDRMTEGYGLNDKALEKLKERGVRVIITIDCGISAHKEAKTAMALGMDLIITDHHEATIVQNSVSLPDAYAALHPTLLLQDCSSLISENVSGLTGVGVAFKLAQALLEADPSDPRLNRCLDLVALGTIADIGKIRGDNRVLVKHGLDMLSYNSAALRLGIGALKQAAGLNGKQVTVGTVGFTLAPRINASGRLNRADAAFRLLITEDSVEASKLAAELESVNRERQAVEESIWSEARELCLKFGYDKSGAIVLASEGWHSGVIGIVASRIVEEFYRPTVLISIKDGVGKGSARSIPGFDLYSGLAECSELLLGFGGHKCAAGLSIEVNRIPDFREKLNALVLERMAATGFTRTLSIDAPVRFGELSFELLQDIERMAPFGQGNPEPRFGARGINVLSIRPIGNNRHLKLRLRQKDSMPIDAIAYGMAQELGSWLRVGSRIAAVFTPRINSWNGNKNIELEIRDIKAER